MFVPFLIPFTKSGSSKSGVPMEKSDRSSLNSVVIRVSPGNFRFYVI